MLTEPIQLDTSRLMTPTEIKGRVHLRGSWRLAIAMKLASLACWVMGPEYGFTLNEDLFRDLQVIDVEDRHSDPTTDA